jgi:hypothetical protein
MSKDKAEKKETNWVVLRTKTADELLVTTQNLGLDPVSELALIRATIRMKQNHPRLSIVNCMLQSARDLKLSV